MNVASQPGAFPGHGGLGAQLLDGAYVADSPAMEAEGRRGDGGSTHAPKPPGLVNERGEAEVQGRAGLVPGVVVVGGADAEAVRTRPEVGVVRRPPCAGVVPVFVIALQ